MFHRLMRVSILVGLAGIGWTGLTRAQDSDSEKLPWEQQEQQEQPAAPSEPAPESPPAGAQEQPEEGPASDPATGTQQEQQEQQRQEIGVIPVNPPDGEKKAEPAPPSAPLDLGKVEVTAQKRKQFIQDVPISMSVLYGGFLRSEGITDIRDAMLLVPNVQIESAGFFAAPRVRGFSFNNNNKAFEPPVGLVLDGIPFSRVEYFNAALFDTDRIEVLRGPQGTTFGKNTTAGLIHLISHEPTAAPEGHITAEFGELQRRHVEAAYGGPVLDGVNVRFAGLFDDRDGFIRNTTHAIVPTAPKRFKDRHRIGVRGTVQMPDLFGSKLTLAAESMQLKDGGAALENLSSGPSFQDTVRRFDPDADFIPGNFKDSEDLPGFRDVSIRTLRGQWDYDLAGWGLVFLGAHSVLKQDLSLDTDFTPAPGILGFGSDFSPTQYFELRTASPVLPGLLGLGFLPGTSSFLVGGVHDRRKILNSQFKFGINDGPFFDLVGAAAEDAGNPDAAGAVGGILGAAPVNPTDTDAGFEEINQEFNQRAKSFSGFFNLSWQFLPKLGVEFGGRYTHEEKSADWNLVFDTPPPHPAFMAIGTEEFTAALSRSENNFMPKVSLIFKPIEDVSLLGHRAKGFKGGGFNAFAFRNDPNDSTNPRNANLKPDLPFGPENAVDWGFDIKTRLFGGAANFNLSLFREVAKNFQVLIRQNPQGTVGLGTSAVVNAPKARSQGIEGDLTWLPAGWMTVIGTIGYDDTEFVKFTDNECPVGHTKDNETGTACIATGKEFPFAPKWSNTLTLNLHSPAGNIPGIGGLLGWGGIELFAGTTVEYQASQLLDLDLDERKRQSDFFRVKANAGFGSPAAGWSLRVIGENLSNAITWVRMGDVFQDVIHGSQNEPRLVFVQFQQNF